MSIALPEGLRHPDPSARLDALNELLATHTPAETISVAAYCLQDPDPGIREAAAEHLVAVGTEEAAQAVVPLIQHPELPVRNLAGEVLVRIGAPSIQALLPYVDIDDADARKFAIDVLAQLPAYDVVDRIAAHLDDPDTNVRLAAIDALAALGATEYAPVLRERYRFYPAERPHILAALGAFRDARGLQLIEAALNDPDPVVQYAAAEALSRYPIPEVLHLLLRQVEQAPPEARPLVLHDLIEAYESATGPVPPLPDRLRPYLLEMLQEPDLSFKKAAVRGLRHMLDEATIEAMLEHAGQHDELDLALFEAISTHPQAFACVARCAETGRMSLDAAAGFAIALLTHGCLDDFQLPQAAQFLQAHFENLDAETKMAAITLALQLQHPAFFGLVQQGLHDPDPAVRHYADDALCTARRSSTYQP